MATFASNTVICYAGTTETPNGKGIRSWSQFIDSCLIAGGWVNTADTGQTDLNTLVGNVANTKAGFRIYRMNDSLQASFPVFMRVDYGSGVNVGNSCGIWLTIGTASNGTGTILGILWNGGAIAQPPILNTNNTPTNPTGVCYASVDPGRASFALFVQGGQAAYILPFSIERTKDALGADTGAGLLLVYSTGTSPAGLGASRYIVYAGGTQPIQENGLNYIISSNTPSQVFPPGDIGVGILFHFQGLSKQPGTNFLITNANDVSSEGQIQLVLYNQARTYVQCGLLVPVKGFAGASVGGGTQDTNARVLMRYD